MNFPSTIHRVLHSHFLIAVCLLIALSISTLAVAQTRPVAVVVLDPSSAWGTWDGWGTSICWMGNAFGDRDDLADLLFTTRDVRFADRTLPGLGMNIVRYNAGASSWNEVDGRKMVVSKIILPYRQIEGFWLDGKNEDPTSTSWNWNVDVKQRAMMQKARDRGVNWFELFSNSPMWWMCANDNPSGAEKGKDDNLRTDHHEKFAVYMAAVAKQAKDHWGITFTTVEPFNEPVTDYWFADCKQEGCHFDASTQAKILPLLRAELDERGLKDMKIAASDETSYDQAIKTWESFDAATRALIDQVNVHGYQKHRGNRDALGKAVAGKRLWNSEYGEEDRSGMQMAANINRDLHQLKPTAWCYWQPLDGGGWGLVDTDMVRKIFRATNPKYHVLAQFTRHIRPGMKILDTGDPATVAAYDESGKKLAIVVTNASDAELVRTFDLSKLNLADGPAKLWITQPRAVTRYEEIGGGAVKGQQIAVTLPARSVQTIELSDVTVK